MLLSAKLKVFNPGMEIDMTISVLGIDIAKNTFQLHGTDCAGNAVLKQRLPRNKRATYVANLPQCLVVMESCGGANYWARVFSEAVIQ